MIFLSPVLFVYVKYGMILNSSFFFYIYITLLQIMPRTKFHASPFFKPSIISFYACSLLVCLFLLYVFYDTYKSSSLFIASSLHFVCIFTCFRWSAYILWYLLFIIVCSSMTIYPLICSICIMSKF